MHIPIRLLAFSLLFGVIHSQAKPCDVGWLKLTSTNKCAKLFVEGATWHVAASHCKQLGGNLLAIHSKEVIDELRKRAFFNYPRMEGPWIGGFRFEDKDFLWSDGTAFDYMNWSKSPGKQPDNSGNNENCVHIWEAKGSWNDYVCSKKMPYICQMPVKDAQSPPSSFDY